MMAGAMPTDAGSTDFGIPRPLTASPLGDCRWSGDGLARTMPYVSNSADAYASKSLRFINYINSDPGISQPLTARSGTKEHEQNDAA